MAGNCWALAQAVGHARPHRLQHLLSGAVWDEDAVRDQVRGVVAHHLGAAGVLIFDETGDLKKGQATTGVGRQYTGTAGRIEVYGRSSELRAVFEQRGIGYVFAIGRDFQITTSGHQKMRADAALGLVEPHGWNRRSAGNGSKGRRLYDWAWTATSSPSHHLLIRRSISTGEPAYDIAYVPDDYVCSLTDLVKVAGTRWAIEDDFQDAKQAVGLDHTQARGYRAWKRHTALALAAYALPAVASALAKATHPAPVLPDDADQKAPADCGMTALTVPEIQRLLIVITRRIQRAPDLAFHLAWSDWRRSHQARARRHRHRARLELMK